MTRLEEIKARLAAISHTGDWRVKCLCLYWQIETEKFNIITRMRHSKICHQVVVGKNYDDNSKIPINNLNSDSDKAVAQFLAHSKADVQWLIEKIEELDTREKKQCNNCKFHLFKNTQHPCDVCNGETFSKWEKP